MAKRQGAAVRIPPPLVAVAALIAAILIDRFAIPWPFPGGLRFVFAAVCVVAALGLGIWALRSFKGAGETPQPWLPRKQLFASGIYAHTRNPMYLGMALFVAGLGAAFGTRWGIPFAFVALAGIHFTAVVHEERYLLGKFGDDYAAYKRRVRRYL